MEEKNCIYILNFRSATAVDQEVVNLLKATKSNPSLLTCEFNLNHWKSGEGVGGERGGRKEIRGRKRGRRGRRRGEEEEDYNCGCQDKNSIEFL